MTWTSLSTRLPGLPLVLAGPLLRKVDPKYGVTVWLAVQRPAEVRLDVHGQFPAQGEPILSGTRSTTRIGRNLHLVAVTATGSRSLSPDKIYSYDLNFTNTEGGPLDFERAMG